MRSSCWAGREIIPTTEDVSEEAKNSIYTVLAAVISCIGDKVKKREGGMGWTRGSNERVKWDEKSTPAKLEKYIAASK